MIGFSTAEIVGRGFDLFSHQVRRGDFDRLLLRPRHTVLQVAGAEFAFARLGRWLQAAVILVWGLASAGIPWTPLRVLLLAETMAGVTVLFLGVFVATAAITFWTVQSLELFAIVTNGAVDAGSYPVTVYRRFLRRFLFFIVPIGTVTYFPGGGPPGPPRPLGHAPLARLGRPRRRPPVPGRHPPPLAPRRPPLQLNRKLIGWLNVDPRLRTDPVSRVLQDDLLRLSAGVAGHDQQPAGRWRSHSSFPASRFLRDLHR